MRIRNVRTWHPDRSLSYLLKIMCTLFQNRKQNSVGCHAQFVHPTLVWRFPLNDSDILIKSIPNRLCPTSSGDNQVLIDSCDKSGHRLADNDDNKLAPCNIQSNDHILTTIHL